MKKKTRMVTEYKTRDGNAPKPKPQPEARKGQTK